MLKQAVVLLAILTIAAAFQAQGFVGPIPEKFKGQTGCYIEAEDAVLPLGEFLSKKSCIKYYCGEKMYSIEGCSTVFTSPPCTLVEDNTKLFPDCCPKVKCPEN